MVYFMLNWGGNNVICYTLWINGDQQLIYSTNQDFSACSWYLWIYELSDLSVESIIISAAHKFCICQIDEFKCESSGSGSGPAD